MSRSKYWVFTLNNYTDTDQQNLRALGNATGTQYLVFGREVARSGTPHLQGFICFTQRKRRTQAQALISTRAHLERTQGTPQQASDYCKKDGDFEEFGTIPGGSGTRTDLRSLYEQCKNGATREEIRESFPAQYIRYKRSIDALVTDFEPVRTWKPHVIILWGRSGAGKTRTIYDYHELSEVYTHPGDKWFNGYAGQPIALFDDYNGSEFKLAYLLKLLDRYPMRVEIKGGFVQWVPKKIYFTSNKDPKTWYSNAHEEHQAALFRRVDEIHHFE